MAKKKNATRKDGRIAVQVYLGVIDGKRKYKTVYGRTQPEADAKALEVKLAMHKGLDLAAEWDTFGEWADHWIKIKSSEVSAGRAVVYKSHIKHLKARLGKAQIAKIRTADIQMIISDLAEHNPNTGKPMARETLCGLKSTALQIFQLAIDNRIMDYNPVNATRIPNAPAPNQRRALTEEEQQWIVDTPHDRAQRAAMIMMYAGLRRGELIPLTWNDVNTEKRTVDINKTVAINNGKFVLKNNEGKSDASIRTIDIPQRLADFLKNEKRDSIYVCSTAKKKRHTISSWDRMWDSYLGDLNIKYGDFTFLEKQNNKKYTSKFQPGGVPMAIPNITPHWLRHTFATMLYLAGVDILTAKEQLGHADIKTTLEIYTHLDAKYKRKSMNKLDNYLDGASQVQVTKPQTAT